MPKNEFVCDCPAIDKRVIELVSAKIPNDDVIASSSDLFKILSSSTRFKILSALMVNEMCVCDLSNVLSMTKSSISHQLKKMKQAGLVKFRKDGLRTIYSPDDGHVESIINNTVSHVKHTYGMD